MGGLLPEGNTIVLNSQSFMTYCQGRTFVRMKIIVYNRQFTNVCVFKFGTVKFHDLLLGENVCPIETLLLNLKFLQVSVFISQNCYF